MPAAPLVSVAKVVSKRFQTGADHRRRSRPRHFQNEDLWDSTLCSVLVFLGKNDFYEKSHLEKRIMQKARFNSHLQSKNQSIAQLFDQSINHLLISHG